MVVAVRPMRYSALMAKPTEVMRFLGKMTCPPIETSRYRFALSRNVLVGIPLVPLSPRLTENRPSTGVTDMVVVTDNVPEAV